MHTYIHTCIHTYIHTRIHTYRLTDRHPCIHTYIHACIQTVPELERKVLGESSHAASISEPATSNPKSWTANPDSPSAPGELQAVKTPEGVEIVPDAGTLFFMRAWAWDARFRASGLFCLDLIIQVLLHQWRNECACKSMLRVSSAKLPAEWVEKKLSEDAFSKLFFSSESVGTACSSRDG